jgi:signal transduction histidine kinase
MANIFNQISHILVQPEGSMVYHLVIAFVFISVLQPVLSFIPREDSDRRKRLLIGVILLIVSRVVVFTISLLSILNTAGLNNALGPVELAVNTLDISIMIWLFAFEKNHKTGDIGLAIFGLLLVAAGMISTIFWNIQGTPEMFNQSRVADGWQIVTLAIVIIGLVTLYLSKSPARAQGILMLAILLIGEGLQLLIAPAEGDYFPISRLTHLIAFPLLVGILQNFISDVPTTDLNSSQKEDKEKDETAPEAINGTTSGELDLVTSEKSTEDTGMVDSSSQVASKMVDFHFYENSVAMAGATSPQEICQLFTKLTAQALLADICLLLTPPDLNGQVHLIAGYDLIVQENLKSTSFDSSHIPRFKKIFDNGRAIHLLDQGNEKMYELADLLRVEEIGNMMAYPVFGDDDEIMAVIALISPYSKHVWNATDQEYLQSALPPITALLQRAIKPQTDENAVKILEEKLALAYSEKIQLEEEKVNLETQMTDLAEKIQQGPPLPPEIEELVVQKESLESAMNLSHEEIQELRQKLEQFEETNRVLEEEKNKTLSEKQALEQEHDRLFEEHRVLATEHAFVLEEKAELETQTETPQEIQAQIDALNFANADLAQKNSEFLSLNEKLAQEKDELNALSEELARRNTDISKENDSLAEKIKELEEENTLIRENLSQVQKEHEEMLINYSENNGNASDIQEELKKALDKTMEFELKLAESTEALNVLKKFRDKADDQAFQNEQDEVIASIAQDLRQPLSSISGYTDLLISESVGILGALQKKFLERVKASTERMNQLVNDLVHVTTIDSGNYLFTLQPLELMDVIDSAIETTSGQFREKEISLRVNINPHLPKLHTDKDALQQIVLHLLQNAGTASPTEGEVLLKAQLYEKSDDVILLSVTDTGEGIPKEDLPRVFSRLYRADNPLIQGVGDTGVGLSIAKTLAEALGGRIWVESETDAGSTYSVLLPTTSPAVSQQEG